MAFGLKFDRSIVMIDSKNYAASLFRGMVNINGMHLKSFISTFHMQLYYVLTFVLEASMIEEYLIQCGKCRVINLNRNS